MALMNEIMTPLTKCILIGAVTLVGAVQASASVLVQESFTYVDGSLTGNGGSGFSGSWGGTVGTGAWSVSNNAAVITGTGTNTDSRFINGVSSSSFYFSYDISVNTLALTGTTNFVDYMRLDVGGTTFFTGIHYQSFGYNVVASSRTGSSTSQTETLLTSTSNTTNINYTIVGYYSFDGSNTSTLSLWINPADETSAATTSVSWATATSATLSKMVLFRSDGLTPARAGTNSTTLDEFLVGSTWADVATSSVPEPNTYSAIVGALALGAGLSRRRRR